MVQGTPFSDEQKAGCARYLRQLFGDLDAAQIDGILEVVGTQSLAAAETLFSQGDAPGAFYVVLSGRLRVIQTGADGTQDVLGDVAAGEPVGELALFTKEPRMASVVAVRPSLLLRVTEEDYLQLIQRFPSLALSLNTFVIRRVRQNSANTRTQAAPRNVAIINLCENTDFPDWCEWTRAEFARTGTEARIIRQPANPADLDDAPSFEAVEDERGLNLFLCEPVADAWTRSCLLYADLVVLAADFHSDEELRQVEKDLELHERHLLGKRRYLLLMHPGGDFPPTGTARWLENRRIRLHLHLREGNERDRRRFCRVMTHRAVGLVLSGGGAKGAAHLGAVQALLEAGMEVDFIGGTSAGAMLAASMSRYDFHWDTLLEMYERLTRNAPTSRDYTWPLLSLMSGRKMRAGLKAIFDDCHLEDLWIPSFCVSANYSAAMPAVHQRGLTRQRVEASIAIPGVFPPVLIDGQLHLDGGLFDNLPIGAMLERPVGYVVAVSLSPNTPRSHDLRELPGSWQLLWDRISGRRRFKLPSLPTLLVNSLVLNSKRQLQASRNEADLFVTVNLEGFGLLDWTRWRDSRKAGYEQTQAKLATLPPEERFWTSLTKDQVSL